ncbi:MAG: sugar ABC transporter substrate-binding protein [Thermomicrobiales bacterium]|nr:sugar ABC transporter substrate-binding protein [Thermomicrobiales bacterium]
MKNVARLGMLAVMMAGAVSVAPVGAQDEVVVGYSAPGLVGAQLEIQQGLVDHAEAKGWTVLTTTSGGDPQKQIDDINTFIAQEVKAIVAVPDDSAGICTAVKAAQEAEIPFYTIDRSPQGCAINMTVLSDNYLAGQQSGEAVAAHLKEKYGEEKGTVLEVTGNLGQNVAQLRGAGFNDVLKQYPNVTVITKTGDWDAAKGVDIVRDVASTEETLDAIYLHSDSVYIPGTLQVLQQLDLAKPRGEEGHIFIAGVDGSPAALQGIRDGLVDQSSSQPIPDFGIIVNYIEMELNGQPIEEGEVIEEGALWSPARIENSEVGPQLFLATTSVGPDNVDDPRLWANVASEREAEATPTS